MKSVDAPPQKEGGWLEHPFWVVCLGICLSILLPFVSLLKPIAIEHFNNKLYDEFLLYNSTGAASDRIAIVDIDERSMTLHGQWPWPRYKIAAVLDKLTESGAAAIGLDMVFPEKDRTSLSVIQENLRRDLNLDIVVSPLQPYPDNDRFLADAIARSSAVLGYQFLFETRIEPSDCLLRPLRVDGADALTASHPLHFFWTATQVASNLRIFAESTPYSGFFNISPDRDGILRSVPLFIGYQNQIYPSLALAVVLKARCIDRVQIQRRNIEYALSFDQTAVPLNANGDILINYKGRGKTFPYISAADLLAGQISESQINQKIIFIGTSAAGLREFRATPTDPLFPGVEIHATVADNLMTGGFLSRPAMATGVETVLALMCGIAFVLAIANADAPRSALSMGAGAAGLFFLSFWLFNTKGVMISPILAIMVLFADFGMVSLLKFWQEEIKTRRRIRDLAMAQAAIIESMASLTETRDPETGGHIKRTQEYVRLLALALKKRPDYRGLLDDETVELLYRSAPLHDIGKVGISDSILLKPGKLSVSEFEEMKKHTTIGRDVINATQKKLGNASFLKIANEITYTHHEKWDGTGYPQGLKGTQIPLSGRLMAVADVYDALISNRVYKSALSHERAVQIMTQEAQSGFDPDILAAFQSLSDEFRKIAQRYSDTLDNLG